MFIFLALCYEVYVTCYVVVLWFQLHFTFFCDKVRKDKIEPQYVFINGLYHIFIRLVSSNIYPNVIKERLNGTDRYYKTVSIIRIFLRNI